MSDLLKRITRYTAKPIGIILDRHAPPPTGEPTVDPEGEWRVSIKNDTNRFCCISGDTF